MNFRQTPELSNRYGDYVVLGVMISLTGFLYRTFKKSEWLKTTPTELLISKSALRSLGRAESQLSS
jgi:hypothetical protein